MIQLEDIAGGMRVETSGGHVELTTPSVMEPCVEFTRFMTSRPDASAHDVNADRQKLRKGVRGYAVGVDGTRKRQSYSRCFEEDYSGIDRGKAMATVNPYGAGCQTKRASICQATVDWRQ